MRKLSVPYTINRRGVYYLNLRWNNQFIRQSLATKDPMEAFQKVSQLAPILSNPEACEQILRQTVSEMGCRTIWTRVLVLCLYGQTTPWYGG